jgi:hypothetical protein
MMRRGSERGVAARGDAYGGTKSPGWMRRTPLRHDGSVVDAEA